MRSSDVIVPAIAVVGGAYALSKLVPGFPDPIKAISDWFSSLFTSQHGIWHFTKPPDQFGKNITATYGEQITIVGTGMLPATPIIYGWKELNYSEQYTTGTEGTIFITFTIDTSTAAGRYTVYLDQRPWGGGYGEGILTVTS